VPLILECAPRGTHLLHERGLRDLWTARLEGRRGIVLQHQLDLGGLMLARNLTDERKRARSRPAVMPALVILFLSLTTRSLTGIAPTKGRRSRLNQCVVTR
jgi:hypothetical protein